MLLVARVILVCSQRKWVVNALHELEKMIFTRLSAFFDFPAFLALFCASSSNLGHDQAFKPL